ncbi:hypothetical protein RUM43_014068 [Polyplax serrata]|uniref:PDZ domain-containing protein n=1 Tax=Polyplax serrata TaxID=468196 RepID=A0AAN8P0A5_POLSC
MGNLAIDFVRIRTSADSWVAVQSLQTSDGGILDPDDRLNDVADDREQIVATFSDGEGPHHGGGDGASGSSVGSVGTGSPDIFQGEGKFYQPPSDIEVTGDQMVTNVLQVRRGSEPALHQLEGPNSVSGSVPGPPVSNSTNKRWSAAPVVSDVDDIRESSKNERIKINGLMPPDWTCHEEEEKSVVQSSKFQRDGSNRLSMQFLPEEIGMKWMERASHGRGSSNRSSHSSLQRDNKRREPLGQANSFNSLPSKNSEYVIEEANLENLKTEYVVLRNEGGPLGIHVVPDYDGDGKDRGLLVQGIEPGGRVHKDGRLSVFDRIIEINGSNLLNEPFQKVQEIFKNSLSSGELRLRVVKHKLTMGPSFLQRQPPPPPIYPLERNSVENMVEGHQRTINCSAKVATVSPTKKLLSGATTANILQTANTRKMGKRIDLELLKGPSGLGFSITTRDNPAGGKCPIYIKNILPQGAAVDDGRLRPGDRLLQVNDIEMTGKTQPEAVAILRQAPTGSIVKMSVSRQEDVHVKDESLDEKDPKLSTHERAITESNIVRPVNVNGETEKFSDEGSNANTGETISRKKPPRSLDESQIFPWRHREILTFDIPVHDTEKAGLGVSVKGKTSANHSATNLNSSNQSVDLGIFVKSVLNGGAASRDGRLKTNDQLLNVNGKSLLSQSNANAMETLRRAMLYMEGPKQGVITLTVARRVSNPGTRENSSYISSTSVDICRDSDGFTPDHSVASEASDSTVIFLPHDSPFKSDRSSDAHVNTSNSCPRSGQKFSSSRNPVIDRLTGHHPNIPNNALRNESYYRATHETTWNIANMVNPNSGGRLNSPTVNPVVAEPVLIEEDYQIGSNMRDPTRRQHDSHKNIDGSVMGSTQSVATHGDVTYASQLSLDESAAGFSRDGIGRQSMSEKRHATLDAKNTDTYRRNKKMREERQMNSDQARQKKISNKIAEIRQELLEPGRALTRPGSAESIAMSLTDCQTTGNAPRGRLDIGPSLGMKKSSSLESLQTMVQEVQMAEDPDPAYTYRNSQGAVRVIRGRGCNESFRAAVDRSYDAPLGLRNHMEMPVSEEESCVGGNEFEDHNILGRGTPRQSSMNAMRDSKLKHHNKKKASLLKGIGSMFRFGKHRKAIDSEYQADMDEEEEDPKREDDVVRQRENARAAAQEEYEKIQEQYRKLIMRQHQDNQGKSENMPNSSYAEPKFAAKDEDRDGRYGMWRPSDAGDSIKDGSNKNSYPSPMERLSFDSTTTNADGDQKTRNRAHEVNKEREIDKQRNICEENRDETQESASQSRSERIHQLRAKHQKRHVERRGQYPFDDKEEKFEQVIRQKLDDSKIHFRQDGYDIYGEMGRPGSRVGISDPARFSHYVNYEEIQQHLNRKKQHYHSQRRDNREPHQRPVSNFYEYESVQSVMRSHHNAQNQTGKRSHQQQHQHSWQNSDSLPRRYENESEMKISSSSVPRRIDLEEFSSLPSVRKTVNYLNRLSSVNGTAPIGSYSYTRAKKDDGRQTTGTSLRARGPYISQITIKENPNES